MSPNEFCYWLKGYIQVNALDIGCVPTPDQMLEICSQLEVALIPESLAGPVEANDEPIAPTLEPMEKVELRDWSDILAAEDLRSLLNDD